MGYIFRSKKAVGRFLKCMEVTDGDEAAAMKEFRSTLTRNGGVGVAVSKVSMSASKSGKIPQAPTPRTIGESC